MTALGSEEQRSRGDQLGADRYLVKSQVGIEDVVRTVHEVLGDGAPAIQPAAVPAPQAQQAAVRPVAPAVTRTAAPTQAAPQTAPQPQAAPAISPIQPPAQRAMAATPYAPPASATTAQPYHAVAQQQPHVPGPITQSATPGSVIKNKVIQPLNDPNASRVNINELLDRELAREAGLNPDEQITAPTVKQEQATINNQIQQFSEQQSSPTIQIDEQGNVTKPAQAPAGPPTPPPTIR